MSDEKEDSTVPPVTCDDDTRGAASTCPGRDREAVDSPTPGHSWGKYLIERHLGGGGEAEVYQAYDRLGAAGHAVAGRHLLRRTARAVVFDDPCGLADLGGNGGVPASFLEALAVAAGPAAEALADLNAPHEAPLPLPLEVAYAEQVKPLREKLQHCMPDHIALARWCIGGIEKQPDRWANRHNWIHREARIFVARNREEIVEIARRLFPNGLATLSVETEPPR